MDGWREWSKRWGGGGIWREGGMEEGGGDAGVDAGGGVDVEGWREAGGVGGGGRGRGCMSQRDGARWRGMWRGREVVGCVEVAEG